MRMEARGSELHEAIDICLGELARAATDKHKKQVHAVRRGALRIKEYVRGFRERF